jgi:hypothetical protein
LLREFRLLSWSTTLKDVSMAEPSRANRRIPIFPDLRNGMLWHCTSLGAFRLIRADGFIRPTQGRRSRWGNRPYACQTLGAICLFDFTTESEERIMESSDRWRQFLSEHSPLTVLLGLSRCRLPGRLVPYPENRDITPKDSSGPIPWVEVCHCGPIPLSACALHVFVSAHDDSRFTVVECLDEENLLRVEAEIEERRQSHT